MPSVSEGPPCLLCGGETSLLYPSNVPNGDAIACSEVACTSPHLAIHDDIYICRPCGLGRSVPPVSSSELADLYRDVEDPDYFTSEEERRATFRKTLKAIERYPFTGPPGRLLEIGAAVGLFLDEARECGWKAVGIEPSRWAAEQAQANGLDVFNGTLEEYRSNGLFDVVVSWDVWEHLTDPVGAVARVAELLAPGGLFCFTTVNMGGLGARLFRGRWPWFMRMHLHYFTRNSATAIVGRSGFDVLRLSTQPKTLKLGYLLDRSRGMFGPVARSARWAAERLRFASLPVRVDLGDILLLEARKNPQPDRNP